jgi:hypothetical protein
MSLLNDNDFHHRIDLFEPGDKTALVCVDVPEVQRMVVENLSQLEYKLHTGLFLEDILLKLHTHVYDVVVISEHFNSATLDSNPILQAIREIQPAQRRKQLVTLIGPSVHTDSEMESWAHSVDLVVGVADVANLKHVLRRAVSRTRAFYDPFIEVLEGAGR